MIVLSLLGGILWVLKKPFYRMGNEVSAQLLKRLVEHESNGVYQLSFDKAELSPFRHRIQLSKVRLNTDSVALIQDSTYKNTYQVKLDSVVIDLKAILPIYFQKKLSIQGIEIVNPEIKVERQNPEMNPIKFGPETGDLYKAVANYLRVLKVDYLRIKSGSLHYSPGNFNLQDFQFFIKNLLIDSANIGKKFLYSDAIDFEVDNQTFLLPDSIHQLQFKKFLLSTKDSLLRFEHMKIIPRPGIDSTDLAKLQQNNAYHIEIPEITLRGINYLKAYVNNHLIIKRAAILNPIIHIQNREFRSDTDPERDNSLIKFLVSVFDALDIQQFDLQSANLDITLNDGRQQRFISPNTTVSLFGIHFDTSNYELKRHKTYFEDARIAIKDYEYVLPDSLHRVNFDDLLINTFDSSLVLKGLHLKPTRKQDTLPIPRFTLDIPQVKLGGLQYHDAVVEGRFITHSMQVTGPQLKVEMPNSQKDNGPVRFTPQALQQLLKSYFTSIKADTFSIVQGALAVGHTIRIGDYALALKNVLLDTGVTSWHHLADEENLVTTGLRYYDYHRQMKAGKITVQHHFRDMALQDFQFKARKGFLAEAKVQNAGLFGINFDSLMGSGQLALDSVFLKAPAFNGRKVPPHRNQDLAWPANLRKVRIVEGQWQGTLPNGDSLQVQRGNAIIGYRGTPFFQYVKGSAVILKSQDLHHALRVRELKFNDAQRKISLEDITLLPQKNVLQAKVAVKIKRIEGTGLHQDSILRHRHVKLDSLIIEAPDLDITGSGLEPNGQNDTAKHKRLLVEANTIRINNGSIQWRKTGDAKTWQVKLPNWSGSVDHFYYNSTQPFDWRKLGFARDLQFKTSAILITSPALDSIQVQALTWQQGKGLVHMQGIAYHQADGKMSLELDGLDLQNWKATTLLKEQGLVAAEAKLGTMHLKGAISLRQGTNKEIFENPFAYIRIGALQLDKSEVHFQNTKTAEKYAVHEVALNAAGLNLPKKIESRKLPDYVQGFHLKGTQFERDLGKLYTVEAKYYQFDYPQKAFWATGIKIAPRYGPYDFSNYIQYQRDWYNFSADTVKVQGLQLYDILDKRYFAQHLRLQNAHMEIFRDKNVPMDPNQRKGLPQEILYHLPFVFHLDTLTVDCSITHQILPENRNIPGKMTYEDLKGNIYHITSRKSLAKEPMLLLAKGRLMDAGNFQAKVIFDMQDPKYPFHFVGDVGSMDLTSMNQMLKPVADVVLKSGKNEELSFDFRGNNAYAEGSMKFRYDNLKIQVLNPQTHTTKGLGQSIKTFFANTFIVRKNNPDFLVLRDGHIFYKRDHRRSIFNLWGKSLLSGIISSIGINKTKKEAKQYDKGKE